MEGNHSRYPLFLRLGVGLVSCYMSAAGILGYLWCGERTEQIIVQNLGPGNEESNVVRGFRIENL